MELLLVSTKTQFFTQITPDFPWNYSWFLRKPRFSLKLLLILTRITPDFKPNPRFSPKLLLISDGLHGITPDCIEITPDFVENPRCNPDYSWFSSELLLISEDYSWITPGPTRITPGFHQNYSWFHHNYSCSPKLLLVLTRITPDSAGFIRFYWSSHWRVRV